MIERGKTLQQRYTIDKQIGQGGMGAVYVATDERFGSTVAIKETLCMDENFRKAMEREARLLNSLKHSALPRVSDHFEESEGLFIVMEFIPGDDVATVLESQKKAFPVDQVLKWADQLLDALDYLHNQELPVIHRDIKPQNLKINSRGEMILLDFGLAKGNPTDASHHTAAKSIFGYSRHYASLEQIQGTGTDPRSDLYSLAATLYHLMTSTPPEDALTRAMSVLSQKADPMPLACDVNHAVPRGVAGILKKALDLNADERPSTAAEMRQMLRESENYAYLADGPSVSSLPVTRHHAEQTRLMPEGTVGVPLATEVKTEVMPANLSQVTSVSSATNAATPGVPLARRRFGLAAAFVTILVVGAAATGLYLVNPSMFGVADDMGETTAPEKDPVVNSVDSAVTDVSGLAVSNSNTTAGSAATGQVADQTRPAPSDKDNARSKQNSQVTTSEDDVTDIDIPMPPVPGEDEVIITERDANGTATKRVLIRPSGNTRPGVDPNNPMPDGFNFRYLTPAQRRRLREAIKAGRTAPIQTPAPPPRN